MALNRFDYVYSHKRLFHVIDTHDVNPSLLNAAHVIHSVDFNSDDDFNMVRDNPSFSYLSHLNMITRIYNTDFAMYNNEVMKFVK